MRNFDNYKKKKKKNQLLHSSFAVYHIIIRLLLAAYHFICLFFDGVAYINDSVSLQYHVF